MTSFETLGRVVQAMRAIASDQAEPPMVRAAARDVVRLLERDRETVINRLLAVATDGTNTVSERRRAIDLLLHFIG